MPRAGGHVNPPRYDLGDNARAGMVVVIDTESQEIVKVIEIDGYGSRLGAAVPNWPSPNRLQDSHGTGSRLSPP